jgi:hypothetical protein
VIGLTGVYEFGGNALTYSSVCRYEKGTTTGCQQGIHYTFEASGAAGGFRVVAYPSFQYFKMDSLVDPVSSLSGFSQVLSICIVWQSDTKSDQKEKSKVVLFIGFKLRPCPLILTVPSVFTHRSVLLERVTLRAR